MPPLSSLQQCIRQKLLTRHEELRLQLQATALAYEDVSPAVRDFKADDDEDARLALNEATLAHAAHELSRIVAMLRRLDNGTYGVCLDCGEPIDQRRLLALPLTPLCADCQRTREAGTGPVR